MKVYGIDGIVESFDSEGQCIHSGYTPHPRNTCGWCGRLHPTNPEGWRDTEGYKIPCEKCEEKALSPVDP